MILIRVEARVVTGRFWYRFKFGELLHLAVYVWYPVLMFSSAQDCSQKRK